MAICCAGHGVAEEVPAVAVMRAAHAFVMPIMTSVAPAGAGGGGCGRGPAGCKGDDQQTNAGRGAATWSSAVAPPDALMMAGGRCIIN